MIVRILAGLTTSDTRVVKSMISERRADEFPKGINSIFTVSKGTTATDTNKGGGGYLWQDETWTLDVLIYTASGRIQDADRRSIQTLAAKVKSIVNGYAPNGQVDSLAFLHLRRDAPVEDFATQASMGLKIRQTYVLPGQLKAQVTGAAAA